ncbi:MFS transporter [Phycicoccus sp. CMS6Z-2]|nr:MFS transporter [Phycicoccus flavus]
MTSLPPLAETVRADLGLSNTAMGVLTTLPVLCMGLLAPAANQVSRRLGPRTAVGVGAALVTAGVVLRGLGPGTVPTLYLGTLVAGAGIAVAGTLLPGVVKSVFPAHRSGFGTGLTMVAMMGLAGVASATAVPLARLLGGWPSSLLFWGLLALAGLLAWLPVVRAERRDRPAADVPDGSHALPWRSTTAWALAGFLAGQSWQFYSSLAWLAPTYEARGWSAGAAGVLMAVFTAVQLLSGLLAPTLLDRVRDPRVLLLTATGLSALGELGVAIAPDLAPWLWALLLGAGQGACFALGLGLLVRFAVTSRDSARLTAMAFLVSYTLASVGPAATGALRDLTGSATAVWTLLLVVAVPQTLSALRLRADAPRVGEEPRPATVRA